MDILEHYTDCDLMIMDGYDDCIIGVVEGIDIEPRVVYQVTKIIKKLCEDGMTPEEAEEFFEFNQKGAYVGENTPLFLYDKEFC